jgi:Lrp/AsnC family transcriptional regulator for asnA, asnC and gidA
MEDTHKKHLYWENTRMTPNGSRIKKLNRVDRQMVSLLQKDGRMPIVTIAKELGISETTARSRLKRLLADDVIKVVAVSNPIRLGFEIIGNIKLSIDLKEKDAILKALKDIDALNYVALTTGGNDIDIEFIAGSLSEFKTLVFEKISQIDGVNSAETSLIVEIIKDTWDFGTAWDE